MVFPVVMYGCESWTIKEAEHRRIDAFELWCWRRLLRVPRTARRSSCSILKEISPEYSLDAEAETPILWPPDAEKWLLRKTLMLGKIEGGRRRGWQRMRWLDGITDSVDMSYSRPWEIVKDRGAWHATVHRVAKSWTWLSDWTELKGPQPPFPDRDQQLDSYLGMKASLEEFRSPLESFSNKVE